jgi:oligopeptide transport system permease protein
MNKPLPTTHPRLATGASRHLPMRASLVILGLIALLCLIGPLASGHPYDQVYRDYVLVRP